MECDLFETIKTRVESVRERVSNACRKSERDPGSVRIVAVAKGFGPEYVDAVIKCGITVIGENRVQEAKLKMPLCSSYAVWHMVGRLQSNKAKEAAKLFNLIHSVDSLKLLREINAAMEKFGGVRDVLLQVNIAGDAAKAGFDPDELPAVFEEISKMRFVEVKGLMTIPPFSNDPEDSRKHFAALRELSVKMKAFSGFDLKELSMGMSNDFDVAIQEGATIVRLGTSIFGPRSSVSWKPAGDFAD